MGDLSVKSFSDQAARHRFLASLLQDVEVLDIMLKRKLFEDNPIRIGAEQELAVTDNDFTPSGRSQSILDICTDEHVTSEIAQYNLEINLDPFVLAGSCFRQTENQLRDLLGKVKDLARTKDQKILLTGILPTINRDHLNRSYMMPYDRYHLISDLMHQQRGSNFEIHIHGTDELIAQLDSVLFEACNTSFQLHLQIRADEFVDQHNWAQQISGPVLAGMVNSPLLLGRALWHETRIALFRQSLDTRTAFNHLRDKQARVFFGNHWLRNSVSMLFKENIARFPQIITRYDVEDSMEELLAGKAPSLRALRIHNGTVYNWNRPCYGRANNLPHLRIENRYIPSGPSMQDEIANFAFWIGLMKGMPEQYQDFYQREPFEAAKDNFYRAARTGLQTVFTWFGKTVSAQELILDELLPMAEAGLQSQNVDPEDIKAYLGIIEKRIRKGITGAQWQLNNFNYLKQSFGADNSLKILTKGMYELQETDQALHEWPDQLHQKYYLSPNSEDKVCQIMNTDLFTVEEQESLALVKALMDWHHIRHMPIENKDGNLVGIVSAKYLDQFDENQSKSVGEIMVTDIISVGRDEPISTCVELMKQHKIGCLPVVRDSKITGIVTDTDLRGFGFG
jgi:CBS domain-containing protein